MVQGVTISSQSCQVFCQHRKNTTQVLNSEQKRSIKYSMLWNFVLPPFRRARCKTFAPYYWYILNQYRRGVFPPLYVFDSRLQNEDHFKVYLHWCNVLPMFTVKYGLFRSTRLYLLVSVQKKGSMYTGIWA